jgi:hypothetical protein
MGRLIRSKFHGALIYRLRFSPIVRDNAKNSLVTYCSVS